MSMKEILLWLKALSLPTKTFSDVFAHVLYFFSISGLELRSSSYLTGLLKEDGAL